MKIDEARAMAISLQGYFCRRCIYAMRGNIVCDVCRYKKYIQEANQLLEELEWYRSQELIKKKDALGIFINQEKGLALGKWIADVVATKYEQIMNIPRVKYEGENNDN